MKNMFKNIFAVTDKGAENLVKSSIASFFVYLVNMFPAMLLMYFISGLVLGNVKDKTVYIIISVVTLIIMYAILSIEYDGLYNSTYSESANLRIDVANVLSNLPLSYFSKHDLSDLSQTVMSDVERIEHAIGHAICKTVGFIMFFPLVVVLLLIGNIKLGLAIILPIIISFSLIVLSKKIQIKASEKHYNKLRENSESFQEAIELQQEIKSFGLNDRIKKDLYKKVEEEEKIHIMSEIALVVPMVTAGLISHLMLGIVIIMGTLMIKTGEISITYFLGYLLFSIKVKDLIDGIDSNIAELFYIDARVNRIKQMRLEKTQEGKDINITSYDIELENVSFSYGEDTDVIKNLSFTANQNEVTALVGMSGCGKTSILRIISRLYDYDKGSIKIGGVDIKDISTKSLFEKISIVFQDVTLFNTSVLENIRLGRADASDDEVKEAAKLANCDEFINKLPNGYDTHIGENGASLSGGERQRISIARAFLKNAPIIILDEISASLDVENEKDIQDSLNKLIKNKTVIIISHRLKSIENVDKIVVIDKGAVEDYGKHSDIVKTSKIYKNLIDKAVLAEKFEY